MRILPDQIKGPTCLSNKQLQVSADNMNLQINQALMVLSLTHYPQLYD